jgi:hypothetical protein
MARAFDLALRPDEGSGALIGGGHPEAAGSE